MLASSRRPRPRTRTSRLMSSALPAFAGAIGLGACVVGSALSACTPGTQLARHTRAPDRRADSGVLEVSERSQRRAVRKALEQAWTPIETGELLGRTAVVEIGAPLEQLSRGERACVEHLLDVGREFERLYREFLHPRAALIRETLADPRASRELATIYEMYPSGTAPLPNRGGKPIVGIEPAPPGRSLYPEDATRAEITEFLQAHPEQHHEILATRTVVRRASLDNLERDRATLARHPVLAALHGELARRLTTMVVDPAAFYALPYAVAFSDAILRAHSGLQAAAAAVRADDANFARFLRARARDLLASEYDGSDALWVGTRFGRLNAQIGSYETYEDHLFGVKAFPALSILVRDLDATRHLQSAIGDLQSLENTLPLDEHIRVRSDLNIGIYHVVADFGQARGTNTASILPNDPHLAHAFGRTVLLRANVMRHPTLTARKTARWQAAVTDAHAHPATAEGNFQRVLWHEVGHYLGVKETVDGRTLPAALQVHDNTLEELKADLVALHLIDTLESRAYYDDAQAQAVRVAGIQRTLQTGPKARTSAYATMQLMQFNYFLDAGVIRFDPAAGRISVDLSRQGETVKKLLSEVLALQRAGSPERAQAFIERWASWSTGLHGVIAEKIRAAVEDPYTRLRYPALRRRAERATMSADHG